MLTFPRMTAIFIFLLAPVYITIVDTPLLHYSTMISPLLQPLEFGTGNNERSSTEPMLSSSPPTNTNATSLGYMMIIIGVVVIVAILMLCWPIKNSSTQQLPIDANSEKELVVKANEVPQKSQAFNSKDYTDTGSSQDSPGTKAESSIIISPRYQYDEGYHTYSKDHVKD